jgi:phosphate transport system substrate-binding protein
VGYEHPDIIATPRPISDAELESCVQNGVSAVTEISVGLNAIVVVNSRKATQHNFTTSKLFAALAAEVQRGKVIVKNPVNRWKEIDPSLPDARIQIIGPVPTSSAYEAFMELVMEAGCESYPSIRALENPRRFEVCHALRRDGAFIEGARNQNAIVDWLKDHPKGFGITSFSVYSQHRDFIAANKVDGVFPTLETVADGSYNLSRPVFVYVKTKHVEAVNGLEEFLYEFTSERSIGPDGYLLDKGLIPLDDRGRNRARDLAISLTTLSRYAGESFFKHTPVAPSIRNAR